MYSWQFSKNFPLPKNGGHFEFLPKIEKQKFPCISLTVQDRAISSKFSTQPMQKGKEAEMIYMYTNKYLSIIDIFYK